MSVLCVLVLKGLKDRMIVYREELVVSWELPVSWGVPYMGGDGRATQCNGSPGISRGGVCLCPASTPSHLVAGDINIDAKHNTVLTRACAGGHQEQLQLFLTQGTSISKV